MKIAIIGYGKMGQLVEKLSLERGHEIVGVLDDHQWSADKIKNADVAIEFTQPGSAVENIMKCLNSNVPVVIGTTGWYSDYENMKLLCEQQNGAMLAATNFSLGVNIFFEINKKLAALMNLNNQYEPQILETHHLQKLDSPSGTAISIANGILEKLNAYNNWEEAENVAKDVLKIQSIRKADVPGTHRVEYQSKEDKITIEHEALNRNGFALGAVIAAEFLKDKKGIYSMKEVLGL